LGSQRSLKPFRPLIVSDPLGKVLLDLPSAFALF